MDLTRDICPLLPKGFDIIPSYTGIVIDGNTTTYTSPSRWKKSVVNRNTTTITGSSGYVTTITTAGNRKTETVADDKGRVFYTEVTVINGNTTTRTTTRQYEWETSSKYEQVVIDKQGTSIFITVTGENLHKLFGGSPWLEF